MKKILKQKRESAALIIALLIVAVAGMVVVAAGRDIVQNNLSTARYTDALNANTLAWAGIEDGLMRVRTANTLNSDLNNFFTPYWPVFNWRPGNLYIEDVASSTNIKRLYQRVIRRNVTETVGTGVQRAGVFYNGPHSTVPDLLQGFGLNYSTPLNESCKDPITGDTFGSCTASRWNQSDSFYDFRVSGSDDDLGPSFNINPSGTRLHRVVNLDNSPSRNIVLKSGYYNVSKSEPAVQGADGYYFIDRIFDLSNYRGNIDDGASGHYAHPDVQKIALKYLVHGLAAGETIMISTAVRYVDPDTTTPVNENLSCYTSPYPQGGFPWGPAGAEQFFAQSGQITSAQNDVETWIWPPILKPCLGDFEGNIDYLMIRFRLHNYPGGVTATGCANCNVSFGLTTSSNLAGAHPYWPRDDSFIGTGVYKIKATGIYNNVKKTVEVWVAKNMYSTAQDPTGQGNFLHCVNLPPPADVNIRNCSIRYFRQINY